MSFLGYDTQRVGDVKTKLRQTRVAYGDGALGEVADELVVKLVSGLAGWLQVVVSVPDVNTVL